MEFIYAYRPRSEHPTIIEDLLDLASANKQEAVDACITMLEDLNTKGLESRFIKKLSGLRLWELKTRSRGGQKGGARVYFYAISSKQALIINAEAKEGNAPSVVKLKEALEILVTYEREYDEKDS